MPNPSPKPTTAGPRDLAPAVIVAAILIILSGMVIPFLRSRVMARAEKRAREDLIALREAIRAFVRDVGLPPTRDKRGNDRTLMRLCGPGRAPEGACECAFEKVRRRYTLEEYKAMEAGIQRGERVPQELDALMADCRAR